MASPSPAGSADRVNIVLSGTVLPGYDPIVVRTNLAALIKRDLEFAGRLLSGHPTKVKSGVDVAAGHRYVAALTRIGVAADLEATTLDLDVGLEIPDRAIPERRHVDSSVLPKSASNSGDSDSPPVSDVDLYRAAIGPRNLAYYLDYFRRADATRRTVLSWNWPAFFFAPGWYFHRKLYGWGVLFGLLVFIYKLFDGPIDRVVASEPDSAQPWLVYVLVPAIALVLSAVFANALYYRRTQRLISKARLAKSRPTDQLLFVKQRGGVLTFSGRNWLIGLVVVLAALAAIWAIDIHTPSPPTGSSHDRRVSRSSVDSAHRPAASAPGVTAARTEFDWSTTVPIDLPPPNSLTSANAAPGVTTGRKEFVDYVVVDYVANRIVSPITTMGADWPPASDSYIDVRAWAMSRFPYLDGNGQVAQSLTAWYGTIATGLDLQSGNIGGTRPGSGAAYLMAIQLVLDGLNRGGMVCSTIAWDSTSEAHQREATRLLKGGPNRIGWSRRCVPG